MTMSMMIKAEKECQESTGEGVVSGTQRIIEESTCIGSLLDECKWNEWKWNTMKNNDVIIGVNSVPWKDDLGFGR